MINGRYVSETKKVRLQHAQLKAELCEVFQVNLFTMPSSIQLELYISRGLIDTLVDVVDVEVPGQHVKTLTCASQLIQEIDFSRLAHSQRKAPKKQEEWLSKPEGDLTEKEKQAIEASKRKDEEAVKSDVKGKIFVKAVWQGNGPKMPPIKSENLFKNMKPHKNRNQYTEDEETRILLKKLYIDVNDPRNERVIKIIKEQRNEFFVKLLNDDAKNMLFDSKPFRHKLMLLRTRDLELAKMPIPLYESEIVDGSRGTFYLEKLENLFREEAYLAHLKARIEDIDIDQGEKNPSKTALNVDLETLKRRQLILDEVKNRQTALNAEGSRANINYKSVIKQVDLDLKNPFQAIFTRLF